MTVINMNSMQQQTGQLTLHRPDYANSNAQTGCSASVVRLRADKRTAPRQRAANCKRRRGSECIGRGR